MKMNSLALTGTLSTMPSEISLGYVMAIPKFTSILNAVEEENYEQLYKLNILKFTRILNAVKEENYEQLYVIYLLRQLF